MNTATAEAGSAENFPSIEAFEAGTFDVEAFNHRAHIYVGWSYLRCFSLTEAIERYSAALRRITRKLGIEGKYNETITWFFLVLIAERMALVPATDWQEFSTLHSDICEDGSGVLRRYYSATRLQSAEARRWFLLPDKRP